MRVDVADVFGVKPGVLEGAFHGKRGPLAVFRYEARARIPLVRAPTLLLYGERDPFCAIQPELAALFPDGRAARVDGGGASPMQHRPADYAGRVLAFLKG